MRLFTARRREAHRGAFPLETLPRQVSRPDLTDLPIRRYATTATNGLSIGPSIAKLIGVLDGLRDGAVAATKADIPDDPIARAKHLKGGAYFLDASQIGICALEAGDFLETPSLSTVQQSATEYDPALQAEVPYPGLDDIVPGESDGETTTDVRHHRFGIVILHEYPRDPNPTEPGADWIVGTQAQRGALRAAEAAVNLANYIRLLGFEARAHTETNTDVNLNRLIIAAGLGAIQGTNGSRQCLNPYLGDRFGVAAISTTLEIKADGALAPGALKSAKNFRWWLGTPGTRPGLAGPLFNKRPFHMGLYPMEKIKRVAETTTLIDTPNIPRVPKRHDFFARGALGDLGKKAAAGMDHGRFIFKAPFGAAMTQVLGGCVPLQAGTPAAEQAAGTDDPKRNAEAIKAALYYLGADMVGICRIPPYAYYSHDSNGDPIDAEHKYAICVLIDQGYETMEGASGDDWISAAQSMRAYMRANLFGGIIADHLRSLGHSARNHSAVDQQVLHLPLLLLAGLGELGRIGEVVMNPYVGPRFKSGIITTNLPLETDQPIDFGLQDFCSKCNKCARECPVAAIPFGDKIMFNGYEMWKPDVEKCGRYRITNSAGSGCGRCMKTCPFNFEGALREKPFLWSALHLPFTRRWIAKLDDKVGNGRLRPIKKWWWDLEADEKDGHLAQAKRVNERDLVFRPPLKAADQKLGCYPVADAPPPDAFDAFPVDRKAAIGRYKNALSPQTYRDKIKRGETRPVRAPWMNGSETSAKPDADGDLGPPAAIGIWKLTLNTPMGERTPTIEIVATDAGPAGKITDETGTHELVDVGAQANQIEFKSTVKTPMGKMKLAFAGTVDGDSLSGRIKTPMGPNPFTGKRISS